MSNQPQEGHVMRCYYDVLNVPRNAPTDDIRRAYLRQSAVVHPDKNPHNIEEATRLFQELRNAYDVLGNADERAWYDSHRERILRGGDVNEDGADDGPEFLNLWKFFNRSAFTRFNDPGQDGFFAVFSRVFATIVNEDADFDPRVRDVALDFGDAATPYSEVARFYSFWQLYHTRKSYAWKDEYKLSALPDRRHRRAAEKINNAARDAARREYSSTVQQLVDYVYRSDPRIEAEQERLEGEQQQRREQREQREQEQHERRAAERRAWMEEAAAAEAESMIGIDEELVILEQLYASMDDGGGGRRGKRGKNRASTVNMHVEPGSVVPTEAGGGAAAASPDAAEETPAARRPPVLRCEHCKKTMQNEKLYAEHCNSNKHKAKLRQLGIDENAVQQNEQNEENSVRESGEPGEENQQQQQQQENEDEEDTQVQQQQQQQQPRVNPRRRRGDKNPLPQQQPQQGQQAEQQEEQPAPTTQQRGNNRRGNNNNNSNNKRGRGGGRRPPTSSASSSEDSSSSSDDAPRGGRGGGGGGARFGGLRRK